MRSSYKKVFTLIIPILILSVVFILDFAFSFSHKFPQQFMWLREGLIVAAFLLSVPFITAHHRTADRNVANKLRNFFLAIFGITLAVVIPRSFLRPHYEFVAEGTSPLLTSLNTLLYSTVVSILVTIFLVAILFVLRDLIFYKSRRHTKRNFRILLLAMFSLVLYSIYSNVERSYFAFEYRGAFWWVLASIVWLFMVINSFRTSWVNYLNKRQKITAFFAGCPLLLISLAVMKLLSSEAIVSSYSIALGAFAKTMSWFISVYIGLSLLSILLHLPTAGIFDRKMREIASLHDLSRVVSSVLDFDKVVVRITDLPFEVINCDFCWLELVDENSGKLYIASGKNLTAQEKATMNLDSKAGVSGWIINNKRPLLINEISRDERSKYLKKWKKGVGSLLGVPLLSHHRVLGILYAMKTEEYGFEQDDLNLLQVFANQAVVAIENARLVQESIEKERLQQELKVAHDAQRKLLPKKMPRVKGLDIDATSITANEVGGDYYGFIEMGEDKIGVVIGDVSGKGASAAFYMAEIKGIIEALGTIYTSPKDLLIKVNQTLYDNIDRKTFVSLIYAVIDRRKSNLIFSRAGHCPLLHFSKKKDKIWFLQPPGLGLGLDRGEIFEQTIKEEKIKISANDVLVFYTDGVTEARNGNQEEFDDKRLVDALTEVKDSCAAAIKDKIVSEVKNFIGTGKAYDDLTMVVIKVR